MDSVRLTPAQAEFLAGRHFATLATLDEDGAPRQAVIWYRLEADGRLLLNSRHPRRWPRNLQRDERVAIAILDVDNGLRWLGFTGVVDEVVDDVAQAREDIMALAYRYSTDGTVDAETEAIFRSQQRITFLVRITGVHDHLAG
ncbi:MAG: pyridoxamine 5'-phosphate oxidase family protein [Chloroflexota bacterium]